jgi:hypothetical protein
MIDNDAWYPANPEPKFDGTTRQQWAWVLEGTASSSLTLAAAYSDAVPSAVSTGTTPGGCGATFWLVRMVAGKLATERAIQPETLEEMTKCMGELYSGRVILDIILESHVSSDLEASMGTMRMIDLGQYKRQGFVTTEIEAAKHPHQRDSLIARYSKFSDGGKSA